MIILRMILITGNRYGFSLLELIVVAGIISCIAAIGSISFHSHLSETILKTSAQDIESTLILARRLAITKREIYRVVFQPDKCKYWIQDSRGYRVEGVAYLGKGISFNNPKIGKLGEEDGIVEAGIPDDAFSFYPEGTAEGGSIYLKDKKSDSWYTITIIPTTGNVRIYQGKH